MFRRIEVEGLGFLPRASLEVGERLTVLTGENGLGKTLFLELAWYGLTGGLWVREPVLPTTEPLPEPDGAARATPTVTFVDEHDAQTVAGFVASRFSWAPSTMAAWRPALGVFVRSDGSFAVWDPLRAGGDVQVAPVFGAQEKLQFVLSAADVFDGLTRVETLTSYDGHVGERRRVLCNGLVRDWSAWRHEHPEWFAKLTTALRGLMDSGLGDLVRETRGVRLSPTDAREVPVLTMPYGPVPLTQLSAGLRRIVALAYVLVWTWFEHHEAARLRRMTPLRELVVLFDEVDAHLHPHWQREVLPALLRVVKALAPEVSVQCIAATHSPLVLASLEPVFDASVDRLVHFRRDGAVVALEAGELTKHGDVVNWLVSDVFGLAQARSREAEEAIEAAERLVRGEGDRNPEALRTREQIHDRLLALLGDRDPFWPRWIVATGAPAA